VAAGEKLVVVTSRRNLKMNDLPIKNFRPIGEFELPEYELQRLSFPPIMQILDYVQREQFTEIIISTPGPMGLTALLAAKMLNLQTSGIYHTDIPEYVRILTEDRFLESLAWSYMHWLYGQVDTVFVNSEQYRQCWINRGFAPDKLKILPRGLDTKLFNPRRRNPSWWQRFGKNGTGVRLLSIFSPRPIEKSVNRGIHSSSSSSATARTRRPWRKPCRTHAFPGTSAANN
jgi:glycosyltransferase involved in cell wall biosynthesis